MYLAEPSSKHYLTDLDATSTYENGRLVSLVKDESRRYIVALPALVRE